MRYLYLLLLLCLLGASCDADKSNLLTSSNMQLTSTAFEQNQLIPSKYTCDGENVSPPLAIADVPEQAKSLVLIMDDPDAPVGVWDHWVAYNIPPGTSLIDEGQTPHGIMGKNTRGNLAYGGPCPPDREHRYFFKLYALDSMLDIAEGATKAEVEKAMEGHVIEQTELMGRYDRSR